MIYDMICQG